MLSLDRQQAKLVNLNARAEKHGEDPVPAADLKFAFDAPNDILSEFDAALKSSLYGKDDSGQGELVDTPGHLPRLRFPKLGVLKWDAKIVGATLIVHHGIDEKSDIVLEGVDVDGFSFECKDGGTVTVGLRAQCHPDERQVGKLFQHIQDDVEITLEPPQSVVNDDGGDD